MRPRLRPGAAVIRGSGSLMLRHWRLANAMSGECQTIGPERPERPEKQLRTYHATHDNGKVSAYPYLFYGVFNVHIFILRYTTRRILTKVINVRRPFGSHHAHRDSGIMNDES